MYVRCSGIVQELHSIAFDAYMLFLFIALLIVILLLIAWKRVLQLSYVLGIHSSLVMRERERGREQIICDALRK